jgi:hypothetical protein
LLCGLRRLCVRRLLVRRLLGGLGWLCVRRLVARRLLCGVLGSGVLACGLLCRGLGCGLLWVGLRLLPPTLLGRLLRWCMLLRDLRMGRASGLLRRVRLRNNLHRRSPPSRRHLLRCLRVVLRRRLLRLVRLVRCLRLLRRLDVLGCLCVLGCLWVVDGLWWVVVGRGRRRLPGLSCLLSSLGLCVRRLLA